MTYQWAVVGAGPAGIAAVGKLLDYGVDGHDIIWIDPKFSIGDFGSIWRNVPSNTKVDLFLKFLHACDAFSYSTCKEDFPLNQAQRDSTCYLNLMAEPLKWVTQHLQSKVHNVLDTVEKLVMHHHAWNVSLKNTSIQAKNVILAIGAEPKKLNFSTPTTIIDLHEAMDKKSINLQLSSEDIIAVFGSSHSAVLVLRNLVENSVNKIINFYRSPLRYAVYLDDWILFDDTGLKGPTAEWARNNLNGDLPNNLLRVYSNKENIQHYLPQCTKAIYAVGFERRSLPIVEGLGELSYIDQAGIIAPGLFGCGIAFPEAKYNRIGILEHRVGLWKFIDFLQRVMPIWLKYSS